MMADDRLAVEVVLDMPSGREARRLEAEVETTTAAEERADIHAPS
jgi:hypothetical protein